MMYKISCFCGQADCGTMTKCAYCTHAAHETCLNKKLQKYICRACKRLAIVDIGADPRHCKLCKINGKLQYMKCEKCSNSFHWACVGLNFSCPNCYCACEKKNKNKVVKCTKCNTIQHNMCVKGEIYDYEEFLCLYCRNSTKFGIPNFAYHLSYALKYENFHKVKRKEPRYDKIHSVLYCTILTYFQRDFNRTKIIQLKDYLPIHHTAQKISGAGIKKAKLSKTQAEDTKDIVNMGMKRIQSNLTFMQRIEKFAGKSIDADFLIGNTPPKKIREGRSKQIEVAKNKKRTKNVASAVKAKPVKKSRPNQLGTFIDGY